MMSSRLRHTPTSLDQRALKTQCLMTPRSYGQIYHEQAYLATYVAQKERRLNGILQEYSETEARLAAEQPTGKTRRQLRKLLNLLRCKYSEASGQHRAMLSRMGEVSMELYSRQMWNGTRQFAVYAQPPTPTPTQTQTQAYAPPAQKPPARESRAGKAGGDAPSPLLSDITEEDGDDEGLSLTPGTPCPSFASSEWSVSSRASSFSAPDDVLVAGPLDGSAAEAAVQEYDGEMPLLCLANHVEMATKGATGDDYVSHAAMGAGEVSAGDDGGSRDLDVGTLLYEYGDEDEDGEGEDEEGVGIGSRARRLSLPAMRFIWPDA